VDEVGQNLQDSIAVAAMRDQMREALEKTTFDAPVLLLTIQDDEAIVSYSSGFCSLSQLVGMLELVKLQQISVWESED
jgi:hypothetical protein